MFTKLTKMMDSTPTVRDQVELAERLEIGREKLRRQGADADASKRRCVDSALQSFAKQKAALSYLFSWKTRCAHCDAKLASSGEDGVKHTGAELLGLMKFEPGQCSGVPCAGSYSYNFCIEIECAGCGQTLRKQTDLYDRGDAERVYRRPLDSLPFCDYCGFDNE